MIDYRQLFELHTNLQYKLSRRWIPWGRATMWQQIYVYIHLWDSSLLFFPQVFFITREKMRGMELSDWEVTYEEH